MIIPDRQLIMGVEFTVEVDQYYLVLPEFPSITGSGDTMQEAIQDAVDTLGKCVRAYVNHPDEKLSEDGLKLKRFLIEKVKP